MVAVSRLMEFNRADLRKMAAPGRTKTEKWQHAGGRRGPVLMSDPNNPHRGPAAARAPRAHRCHRRQEVRRLAVDIATPDRERLGSM